MAFYRRVVRALTFAPLGQADRNSYVIGAGRRPTLPNALSRGTRERHKFVARQRHSKVARNLESGQRKRPCIGDTNEGTTAFAAKVSSGLIECVERASRVDKRRSGVDADSDAKRLGDFLLSGAELLRCRSVDGDTAVAAQADRHGKRDELARLCIRCPVFVPAPPSAA